MPAGAPLLDEALELVAKLGLAVQLDVIIAAVARVQEVTAEDIPPTSHAVPLTNVYRPDEVRQGLTPEQALSGAPAAEEQRFRVPRILEEEA